MSVELPEPVPLDPPRGDPAAVDDLVRDVTGAAYRLATVTDQLAGPAVSAPGWLGADAAAAEAQLVRVAGIARAAGEALLSAAGRLSAHGELLRDTRREVAVLREEQDEDFRAAWRRLGEIEDPVQAVMTGSPARTAVVADVASSEARRRRRHALLLEDVAADAAGTARDLADACRRVGGTGRSGDGVRVLAHLAAELPGWGEPELARRGLAMSRALDGELAAADWNEAALEAASLAGSRAFAEELLLGLGADGLQRLLILLGDGALGDDMDGEVSAVARLTALALGAADGSDRAAVEAVLAGAYVDARRTGTDPDLVALGMGVVLAVPAGASGPGAATVASWGRQIVAREHAMAGDRGGTRAVDRVFPDVADTDLLDRFDPVPLVLESLARDGDARSAASFLRNPHTWTVLLDRSWPDDGAALRSVVERMAGASGPDGAVAVRSALEAVGGGLGATDPDDWTVDRDVVAAVAPALGDAVVAHVDVAADALASLSADGGGEGTVDQVKGLGYLTVDRQTAAVVERALAEWAGAQSHDLAGSSRADPLPAVAVPAAYAAAQEYGQRLTYALDGFELQEAAEDRARLWNWTAGLLLEAASLARFTPVGVAADIIGAYGPLVLGTDGSFVPGRDRGMRFDAHGAGVQALATLSPDLADRAAAVAAQAEASYRRTAERLGSPEAPVSAGPDWHGATLDLVTGGTSDLLTDDLRDRAGRNSRGGSPGDPPSGRR